MAGVQVGKPLGWSTSPGWDLCVIQGVELWAPNLHLRLSLITVIFRIAFIEYIM